MISFRQFLENAMPLIGTDDGLSTGSSMLAKKMQLKQENPVLHGAIEKVRKVFMSVKSGGVMGNYKLKIGDNVIHGGSLSLIQKWGLSHPEVSALKKAGLLTDNGIGDVILKIEPFNM